MREQSLDLRVRPRRLRQLPLREMVQRVSVRPSDIIVPVFVCEGKGQRREVGSMPGIFQMSVDVALEWLSPAAGGGICGVPDLRRDRSRQEGCDGVAGAG